MYKFLLIILFAYGLAVTIDDMYDNSYALIIGIDKYQNEYVPHLNYAVKDAESIQDILVNTFDFQNDNVILLKNEEATKQNIIQAFADITAKAEERDRVLIYFAGHGDTDDLPEGGEMGYLLPVDGDSDNLFVTSIAMDDLKRISLMSKAKHLLYLVDACYGGLLTIGSRGLDPRTTTNYIDKIAKDKSRQIITAGGRGEKVIEKSEWGHSAFTLNLNRGLKNGKADMDEDGYITANELGIFLKKKVTIDSDNQQTPQYGRMTSQEGEFVFAYGESKKAPISLLPRIPSIENPSWYDKYGYKRRGIGFFAYEDDFSISFTQDINKTTNFTIMYMQVGKNTIKNYITSDDDYSLSANLLGFAVALTSPYNEKTIVPFIACGTAYMMTSWENKTTKISGDKNIILYSGGGGVAVFPLQYEKPFPWDVSFTVGVTGTYLPTLYTVKDELVTLKKWKIKIFPAIVLSFGVPI